MNNYKKPESEVLYFDLEEVRMKVELESTNDGNDPYNGDKDGDQNGDRA